MSFTDVHDVQSLVQIAGTIIAIIGGLVGLRKYLSDIKEKDLREKEKEVRERDTEVREWQKVAIYKIFRQSEKPLKFSKIREDYLREAQAVIGFDIKKKEITGDALCRVLLELTSSGILGMGPSDSFWLNARPDPDMINRINQELLRTVGSNPFKYTLDDVLKEIAPKIGTEIPLLRTDLLQSIKVGNFVLDKDGKIAFADGPPSAVH